MTLLLHIALLKFDLDIFKSLFKSNSIFKKSNLKEYEKWGNYCDIKYILEVYTKIYKFKDIMDCNNSLLNLYSQTKSINIFINNLFDTFLNVFLLHKMDNLSSVWLKIILHFRT